MASRESSTSWKKILTPSRQAAKKHRVASLRVPLPDQVGHLCYFGCGSAALCVSVANNGLDCALTASYAGHGTDSSSETPRLASTIPGVCRFATQNACP